MRGFAELKNKGTRPVIIDQLQEVGFLKCHDLETNDSYLIFQQQFTPMPTIPSRFRRYVFEQVAPFWAQALERYPNAIIITPTKISPETLVRKLREGREAKNRHAWTSPLVNEAKWAELSGKIMVTPLNDGKVQMGPPEAKETVGFQAVVTTKNEIFIKWEKEEELESFCKLVRLFDPKPSFVVLGLNPKLIESLEQRYDVGFEVREDKKSWDVIF